MVNFEFFLFLKIGNVYGYKCDYLLLLKYIIDKKIFDIIINNCVVIVRKSYIFFDYL